MARPRRALNPTPPGQHFRERTHCPAGHPYDEANTRRYTKPGGYVGRYCRACNRLRAAANRAAAKRNKTDVQDV